MKTIKEDQNKTFNTPFGEYDPSKEKELTREFLRQEVVDLSQKLLGKILVRETPQGFIRAVIVQTEAYKAPLDKACHAYNNKKTQRTKYFWLDGGHLYLYTIYGPANVCMNVVASIEGEPQAVLIRAVHPIQGLPIIMKARNIKSNKLQDLTNGPAKVCASLGIKMDLNGIDLTKGEFKIVDGGITNFSVGMSRRINIDYAEQWIQKEWRFYIIGNKFVSKLPSKKAVQPSVQKGQTKLKVASKSKGKEQKKLK